MFDYFVKYSIVAIVLGIVCISIILWTGYYIGVYSIPPVEEPKIDSINSVIDSLNFEIINLDSIRNENLKKAVNLNDSDSVELFWWLLSK